MTVEVAVLVVMAAVAAAGWVGATLATVASAKALPAGMAARGATKVDTAVAVAEEAACLAGLPVEAVWA